MFKIKIKYHNETDTRLKKIPNGDWIDLYVAENIYMEPGDFKLIPLGVSMKLPPNHEAHVVPRSSTFKRHGILQTNSFGIIDESYCGDTDEWKFPAYATRQVRIDAGTAICQFRIQKKMGEVDFEEVEYLNEKSRGGFGSTDAHVYGSTVTQETDLPSNISVEPRT